MADETKETKAAEAEEQKVEKTEAPEEKVEAKETAEDLANIVAQQQAPPGTPVPEKKETDDEYVLPEPDTESVPPSPVTGQTADESQEKPGQ